MSTEAPLDRPLDRRFLIRGGAVLAGAAGASVLGAALAPTQAEAANEDAVVLGQNNAATSPTTITIDGAAGGPDPTLRLNNADGPSLALQPLAQNFDGPLEVGEIVNTRVGPNIGVDYGDGAVTTFFATGVDLTNAYPLPAERLLDTRSAASRAGVVNPSSRAPFDSIGRLKGGTSIDVVVADTGTPILGLFLNITAFRPTAGGYLEVYTPGERPGRASLPFQRLVTIANSTFVAPGIFRGSYTVRVYASASTQVQLDLLGVIAGFAPSGPAASAAAPLRRLARQAKQRERLVSSVRNRATR